MKKKVSNIKEKKITNKQKDNQNDNPSWYHYVFVLFCFFLIIYGIILIYDFYEKRYFLEKQENISNLILHNIEYKVGNVTYNLNFRNSREDLKNSNIIIQPTKIDVLNTLRFNFSFLNYSSQDNLEVLKASTLFVRFLGRVYKFQFNSNDFNNFENLNCSLSNNDYKVVVFNPYSKKEGIFFNKSNGCIEFLTNDSKRMNFLVEKFIFELINQ